jgi:hypothetical protein
MPREKARKNLRKSIVNYERDFPNWRGYVSKFHAITNRMVNWRYCRSEVEQFYSASDADVCHPFIKTTDRPGSLRPIEEWPVPLKGRKVAQVQC